MNNLWANALSFLKKEGIMNTLTLSIGVGISQLIIFIIQLVTRRLFTPEEFGAYDVYFNIFGVLVVFVALRYEMAIVLPKEDSMASNLAVLAILFSFGLNFLIFIFVLIFRPLVASLLNFPLKYSFWLLLLPATTFLFSSYQVINYWLIRKKAFRLSSVNKITRRSTEGTTQIIFGYLKSSFGLVLGDLLGNFVNYLMGLRQLFRYNFSLKPVTRYNLGIAFRKYIQFPKYNLLPALLNTISTALPFLIINKFYGGSITGYFGLSKMILAIPIALISTSVSQVLLQRLTEKRNSGISIKKDINHTAFYLAAMGLIGVLVLSLWGVELLTFLFDKTWKRSGEFIQIIVFASAFNFIVSPLSIIFVALEKLNIQAVWQSLYFLLTLCLFLFRRLGIDEFLFIYVILDVVSYSAYFILIERVMVKYENSLRPV